jgi:uncharacterized C2H2 Zn-finger protein
MSSSATPQIKRVEQRVKNGTLFTCPRCGTLFQPLYEQHERGWGYCSRACVPRDKPRSEASRARSRAAALKNVRMMRERKQATE